MNTVTIKDLVVAIDGQPILTAISLQLKKTQIACLLGKSGCGKTTLLRCIAGFERQQQGSITIDGQTISSAEVHTPVEARKVGMVFQDYALFPHLNVAANISFGLSQFSAPHKEQRLAQLIDLFALAPLLKKYPHHLSGGEQQRIALARAIAPQPKVLLLDEPFANLDIELREQLARELRTILKQDEVTTIMVSHNQLEAFAMADVIGVIDDGQLIQWDSAFNLYHQPNSIKVADFIGEGVLIPGQVKTHNEVKTEIGPIYGTVPEAINIGDAVNVLIRPDDILHDDYSTMTARVKDKAFRGAEFLYTLELVSGQQLLSLVPSHHDHPLDQPIGIKLEIDHLVVFPKTVALK